MQGNNAIALIIILLTLGLMFLGVVIHRFRNRDRRHALRELEKANPDVVEV